MYITDKYPLQRLSAILKCLATDSWLVLATVRLVARASSLATLSSAPPGRQLMTQSESRAVLLWTVRRSGSTTFERSIRELDGVTVVHEPHRKAYYFGPDKLHPHRHHQNEDGSVVPDPYDAFHDPTATFEAVRANLISKKKECAMKREHFFVKDIPYFLGGQYTEYMKGGFEEFKHTFLIRHPLRVAHSWYKIMKYGRPFDCKEFGYEESLALYEAVKSTIDPNPIVIDADDLFAQPR